MQILDVEQGSAEWLIARAGKVTASNADKIVTSTGKLSASAQTYINTIIAERLMGDKVSSYQNEWMARGVELEPEARSFYEYLTDNIVYEVGLCVHDELEASCSPDGLIGDDGGLEIKCPALKKHYKTLKDQKVPTEHIPQIQGSLWITEREWWDFLSYYPNGSYFYKRVYRDEKYIAGLEIAIFEFVDNMQKIEKEVLKVI